MIGFKVAFILLSLVSVVCIIQGIRLKRKNMGFLTMAGIIAVCNLICIGIEDIQGASDARNILMPYYFLHAWFLFAALIMIVCIEKFKLRWISLVLMGGTCAYQTYLVISQFFGARIFSFQKRIYFRKAWWVVTDSKNTGLLFSFRSYRIMLCINAVIILAVLLACILRSHRVFRMRFVYLIVTAVVYSLLEVVVTLFALPIWIPCAAYTVISLLGLYLTGYYGRNKLREWSLDNFANDMSDGLILYDEHNDLVHINDMIRDTLNINLVDSFENRSRLDEWVEASADPENRGILSYIGADHVYYFKVNIQELGDKNDSIGTLYIIHDTTDSVTRIKAVERANEELERANRMKSDFLANMSHEIRTPMNAVIGMAEIAMRENRSPQIGSYLTQIQNSGRNLLNIINDILDYSKIESGKMEIIEDEYTPFTELSYISNVLATRLEDKPVELFCLIESELPHTLLGDAMRIRQVLINLAGNAVKFTPSGMVSIRVRCEWISRDMVNVIYHVIDTGIGIKKEDLDKLFISFQQVDSKRNRSVEGTGLGLAISQRLVDAMHGEIGVSSEYGKGSDFWFSIPQRVIDRTNDISVDDYSGKHAYVLSDRLDMVSEFTAEMERLGVEASVIGALDEYVPSGKKDYIFIEENKYDEARSFIEEHADVTVVVLTSFASEFESDIANIRIMRKPETTMLMVNILNDAENELHHKEDKGPFAIDYMAPKAQILAVDDNAINLTIIKGLLAPLKVRIDSATGGREAVEKAAENDYDIILMDHMMPEVDGVDATRIIRQSSSGRQPVIIAVSANVMEEARHLFKEVGMNDFIAKPVDVEDMVTKLKKWLPADKIIEIDPMENDGEADGTVIAIPGLDTDTAVKSLGSVALFEKIAGEYYKSGSEKLNGIMAAYSNEDWEDYTIRVHALKSSSRQIGAMELGNMAEALEKAGKAGDIHTIRNDTDETINAYKKLLERLSPYFETGKGDSADKPAMDPDTLGGLLDTLSEACDNLDMDRMEEVDEGLRQYSYEGDVAGLIDDLHKAIGEIDTDECMELVRRIRGDLGL